MTWGREDVAFSLCSGHRPSAWVGGSFFCWTPGIGWAVQSQPTCYAQSCYCNPWGFCSTTWLILRQYCLCFYRWTEKCSFRFSCQSVTLGKDQGNHGKVLCHISDWQLVCVSQSYKRLNFFPIHYWILILMKSSRTQVPLGMNFVCCIEGNLAFVSWWVLYCR